MDAVRLIVTSGRALAAGGEVPEVLTEVWQVQALAQAIGSRLAVHGPPELRGEAIGLTELAGRGCGVLHTRSWPRASCAPPSSPNWATPGRP